MRQALTGWFGAQTPWATFRFDLKPGGVWGSGRLSPSSRVGGSRHRSIEGEEVLIPGVKARGQGTSGGRICSLPGLTPGAARPRWKH